MNEADEKLIEEAGNFTNSVIIVDAVLMLAFGGVLQYADMAINRMLAVGLFAAIVVSLFLAIITNASTFLYLGRLARGGHRTFMSGTLKFFVVLQYLLVLIEFVLAVGLIVPGLGV